MRGQTGRNRIKQVIALVILLASALFILNIILTSRLERYLKKELVERTSKATDGFYNLSFDDLSISFFKGELTISGITLTPDSATFQLWKSKDSLPDIYVKAKVGTIGFKGVNLTWRLDFKRLHFRSFEIKSPQIHLFSPLYINQNTKTKDKHTEPKTLYEIISPYIDVLSVQTLNLENASLFYTVQNTVTPIVYALDDVSFHGYGFWLDSLSSRDGKLLYCNNFNFKTNRSQKLLTNNDFLLRTDSIFLDTQDSIIYIKNIRILPQESLWKEKKQKPDKYLSALINNIETKGIFFTRKNGLNYLTARSFSISNPNIKAFNQVSNKSDKDTTTNITETDSIVQALSLYDVISPVLHSVYIYQIAINNAQLNYSQSKHQLTDVYQINSFNFLGNEFLIDSLSFEKYDLGYFSNFSFDALGIDGMIKTRNYHIYMKNMMLNTEARHFQINNISLNPISTQHHKDYISGHIDSVSLKGLYYDKSNKSSLLNMGNLMIIKPELLYKQYSRKETQLPKASQKLLQLNDIYKHLGSFTQQIVMDKMKISNGSIKYVYAFNDSIQIKEKVSSFELELTGISIDNITQNIKLNDIYFQTKNLRIPLNNGFYFLNIGNLKLEQSQLTLDSLHLVSPYSKMEFAYKQPKHKDWFDVAVGHISLTGIDIPYYLDHNQLRIADLQIKNVLLQNFKNKKIYVEPRIVPMIYTAIQKAPILFSIQEADIKNVSVIYEELEEKGTQPGKLYFTEMNGHFSGLTNIVSSKDQYIKLDANGKLMGQGYFAATWQLPVDSLNDRFILDAKMDSLHLTALNDIITPLISAKIKSGWTNGLVFHITASSKGGEIELQFPYRNLKISLLKEKDDEIHSNTFLSGLANLLIRHDNPHHPEKANSKLRYVNMYIERDPHHSTFNYLWQLLRPAVIASIGVSKTEQDAAKSIATFFHKVKRFFEGEIEKIKTHKEEEKHTEDE